MNSFILAFETVFPLFAMMALGYLIRAMHLVNEDTISQMNRLIFKLFLPLNNFRNIYHTDLSVSFNPKLILFGVIAVFTIFFLAFPVFNLIEKSTDRRGVLVQTAFRSNFLLYGVPVSISLCGQVGGSVASMLAAVIIPIFNALAVIDLEIYKSSKVNVKKILIGILTNPLIICSALAVIMLALQIKLPVFLDDVVADVSALATPSALIFLGASFTLSAVHDRVRPLIIGIATRLVVIPCIGITAAYFLGFRGVEMAALLSLFASPSAVSSYTMVEQIGGDSQLASQLVVLTSLVSIGTIFIWVVVLKGLALI